MMTPLQFYRWLVILNGLVPLAILGWDASQGQLGANPVNSALHVTGILSLVFLFLSLTISPLKRITGWGGWIAFRRALGLYGFFYALVHLAIYVALDRAGNLSSTVHEIWTRRFLQIGIISVLLMVPLAVTSTNDMLRKLGAKRWKLLHRLAYVVAGLGVLHYFLLVKSDVRQPLAFAGVLACLLASRFGWHYFELRKAALRPAAPPAQPAPLRKKIWVGELEVVHRFDETPDVRTFRLVSPDGGPLPFTHLPGQYLSLQLTIDGQRVNRSYTIASSPTRNGYCEVTIKREDAGLVSSHLHRNLRVGDRLRVTAPAGKFVFTGSESNSVVLIGGGVGITPLMSITRYLTDRGWPGEIFLLLVVKSPNDIIFRDELEWLQKRFPNLHVEITLTRAAADDAWIGNRGRASADWLMRSVPALQERRFYLCGPEEMMSATQGLLSDIGVDAARIFTEAFVSPGISSRDTEPDELARLTDSRNSSHGSGQMTVDAVASNGHHELKAEPGSLSTLHFARSHKSTAIFGETTVLEASESIGLNLPFECRSGICGQCKIRLVTGMVTMDVEDALSRAEKQAGMILACQSRCCGDLTVDA